MLNVVSQQKGFEFFTNVFTPIVAIVLLYHMVQYQPRIAQLP